MIELNSSIFDTSLEHYPQQTCFMFAEDNAFPVAKGRINETF